MIIDFVIGIMLLGSLFHFSMAIWNIRVISPFGMSKKSYYWVYVSAALKGKYVAIEDIGNGIWRVFFRNVFLGFFDQRNLRNKQESTRLETNLV